MTSEESRLQQACKLWFDGAWPEYRTLFFAVPNGANVTEKQRMKLTAEGMTRGVADTLLVVPSHDGRYHCLGVEFKKKNYNTTLDRKTGTCRLKVTHTKQSPDQVAWQKAFEQAGNRYVVVWDYEDFQKVIAEHLGEDRVQTLTRYFHEKRNNP